MSFIWGKMRTAAQAAASWIALRRLQRGSGGRWSSIPLSTHFTKVFCQSQGSDITMKGFSAFLDMKRCRIEIINLFLKTSYYLKNYPNRLPGAQSASLHPELLQGCYRATAAAISAEADGECPCCSVICNALGKCQFVVDNVFLVSELCIHRLS